MAFDLTQHLRALEEELLDPTVRRTPARTSQLLHEEFVEIGSSGKLWNRQQVVKGMQSEETCCRSIEAFSLRSLSKDAALVTYCLIHNSARHSWRSSLWVCDASRWRMVFHQGTRICAT